MANVINPEGQARDVIVVGASAGGVQALMHLLSKMPGDLPAVVGIVLHRTPYHETRLPWVLGLIEINGAGGLTLVQDPREAAHPTMPRRAIAEDNVTAVLPLDGIASTLIALARGLSVAGTHAEISR